MKLTRFENKVIAALKKIPPGKITTYGLIARWIGQPAAARAVGNACNKNPDAPRVPCHRVAKSNGRLGGYTRGMKKKIELLKREGILVGRGKIKDFKRKIFWF